VPFVSQQRNDMERGKSTELLQLFVVGMDRCVLRVSVPGRITFFGWLWFRVSNLRQPLLFTE
jgi:hypothetical protein